MGRGGSDLVRRVVVTYTCLAVWLATSFSVIVFNKYILDRKMYNWPYPITLTMIHMLFCSAVAFVLVRGFKIVDTVAMPRDLYVSSVLPIGALYALSLWFSNSAYIYLSVSFIQMLKALMPVAVYSLSVLMHREVYRGSTMTNMLSISLGVAIAAYGEAHFNAVGVTLQMAAVATEATRLVMIQILLNSKGITLNPITSLYYVAPCCLAFLSVPWLLVEWPRLRENSSFHFDTLLFTANAACAFTLNLSVFLLIGKTSALTMNIGGVVKDWLLIAFSWSVIRDRVTALNLIGYILAFLGVLYYNHAKYEDMKARDAAAQKNEDEESAFLNSAGGGNNSDSDGGGAADKLGTELAKK